MSEADGGQLNDFRSYRDLEVWQRGMDLAVAVFKLTRCLPRQDQFWLGTQMLKAAGSVPANVSEGHGRQSTQDFIRFLRIAQGSLKELETHLILGTRVELFQVPQTDALLADCDRLGRMIRGLIRSLERRRDSR